MQRREFIKRLIGADVKTLLTIAGILLVVYILFSADFTNAPGNMIAAVKVAGFLLMFYLLCLIAAILVSILLKQFLKLLPGKISVWLREYGEKILLTIAALLSGYFI